MQNIVCALLFGAALLVAAVRGCGDHCSDACTLDLNTLVTDSTTNRPFSNVSCPYSHVNRGAWYKVVGTGRAITLDTCDDQTTFDTMIYLYSSCAQEGGVMPYPSYSDCIDYDDDGCGAHRSKLSFQSNMGGYYYVFVTGFGSNTGTYYLAAQDHVPPTNFHCYDAFNVTTMPFSGAGDTSTSTVVYDACQDKMSAGMWYKVHGNGEPFVAHTCSLDTNFDTVIGVFLSCNSTEASQCITVNDDYCWTQSLVWWRSVMNTDYWIFVSGHDNARGAFTLVIEHTTMNPYSKCDEPVTIAQLPFVHTADTSKLEASYSACNQRTMHAMWFRMPGIGRKVIATTCNTLDNTIGDTVIDVYTGCDMSTHVASTCVATNDDYCGVHSAVIFYAVEPLYYISVSGFASTLDGVNFTLSVMPYEDANNSQCWYAQEIESLPEDVSGNTRNQELSTVGCVAGIAPRKGAWYKYTHKGPRSLMTATTCNRQNIMHSRLEVHTDCHAYYCLAQAGLDPKTNCTEVTFPIEPFITYYVFVTAEDTANPGSYFHVDFYEHVSSNYSTCDAAERVPLALLPFRTEQYTGLSKPVWSACRRDYYQGYWVRIEGDGTKYVATTCDAQTDSDTVIELYDRCPHDNVSEGCIDYNDDYQPCGLASQLEFDTQRGAIYWLFVSTLRNAGIFVLRVYSVESPSNIHCLHSKGITTLPYYDFGVTTYAAFSNASCQVGTRKGLWYSFVGDNRWVSVETCGIETDFETDIEIYLDCDKEGGKICYDHQHDSKCAPQAVITFPALLGQIYWVYITGVRAGIMAEGFFKLSILPDKKIEPASSSGNGGNGLTAGQIVGIVIACFCGVGLIAGLAAFIYVRAKKRSEYVQLPGGGSSSVQASQ